MSLISIAFFSILFLSFLFWGDLRVVDASTVYLPCFQYTEASSTLLLVLNKLRPLPPTWLPNVPLVTWKDVSSTTFVHCTQNETTGAGMRISITLDLKDFDQHALQHLAFYEYPTQLQISSFVVIGSSSTSKDAGFLIDVDLSNLPKTIETFSANYARLRFPNFSTTIKSATSAIEPSFLETTNSSIIPLGTKPPFLSTLDISYCNVHGVFDLRTFFCWKCWEPLTFRARGNFLRGAFEAQAFIFSTNLESGVRLDLRENPYLTTVVVNSLWDYTSQIDVSLYFDTPRVGMLPIAYPVKDSFVSTAEVYCSAGSSSSIPPNGELSTLLRFAKQQSDIPFTRNSTSGVATDKDTRGIEMIHGVKPLLKNGETGMEAFECGTNSQLARDWFNDAGTISWSLDATSTGFIVGSSMIPSLLADCLMGEEVERYQQGHLVPSYLLVDLHSYSTLKMMNNASNTSTPFLTFSKSFCGGFESGTQYYSFYNKNTNEFSDVNIFPSVGLETFNVVSRHYLWNSSSQSNDVTMAVFPWNVAAWQLMTAVFRNHGTLPKQKLLDGEEIKGNWRTASPLHGWSPGNYWQFGIQFMNDNGQNFSMVRMSAAPIAIDRYCLLNETQQFELTVKAGSTVLSTTLPVPGQEKEEPLVCSSLDKQLLLYNSDVLKHQSSTLFQTFEEPQRVLSALRNCLPNSTVFPNGTVVTRTGDWQLENSGVILPNIQGGATLGVIFFSASAKGSNDGDHFLLQQQFSPDSCATLIPESITELCAITDFGRGSLRINLTRSFSSSSQQQQHYGATLTYTNRGSFYNSVFECDARKDVIWLNDNGSYSTQEELGTYGRPVLFFDKIYEAWRQCLPTSNDVELLQKPFTKAAFSSTTNLFTLFDSSSPRPRTFRAGERGCPRSTLSWCENEFPRTASKEKLGPTTDNDDSNQESRSVEWTSKPKPTGRSSTSFYAWSTGSKPVDTCFEFSELFWTEKQNSHSSNNNNNNNNDDMSATTLQQLQQICFPSCFTRMDQCGVTAELLRYVTSCFLAHGASLDSVPLPSTIPTSTPAPTNCTRTETETDCPRTFAGTELNTTFCLSDGNTDNDNNKNSQEQQDASSFLAAIVSALNRTRVSRGKQKVKFHCGSDSGSQPVLRICSSSSSETDLMKEMDLLSARIQSETLQIQCTPCISYIGTRAYPFPLLSIFFSALRATLFIFLANLIGPYAAPLVRIRHRIFVFLKRVYTGEEERISVQNAELRWQLALLTPEWVETEAELERRLEEFATAVENRVRSSSSSSGFDSPNNTSGNVDVELSTDKQKRCKQLFLSCLRRKICLNKNRLPPSASSAVVSATFLDLWEACMFVATLNLDSETRPDRFIKISSSNRRKNKNRSKQKNKSQDDDDNEKEQEEEEVFSDKEDDENDVEVEHEHVNVNSKAHMLNDDDDNDDDDDQFKYYFSDKTELFLQPGPDSTRHWEVAATAPSNDYNYSKITSDVGSELKSEVAADDEEQQNLATTSVGANASFTGSSTTGEQQQQRQKQRNTEKAFAYVRLRSRLHAIDLDPSIRWQPFRMRSQLLSSKVYDVPSVILVFDSIFMLIFAAVVLFDVVGTGVNTKKNGGSGFERYELFYFALINSTIVIELLLNSSFQTLYNLPPSSSSSSSKIPEQQQQQQQQKDHNADETTKLLLHPHQQDEDNELLSQNSSFSIVLQSLVHSSRHLLQNNYFLLSFLLLVPAILTHIIPSFFIFIIVSVPVILFCVITVVVCNRIAAHADPDQFNTSIGQRLLVIGPAVVSRLVITMLVIFLFQALFNYSVLEASGLSFTHSDDDDDHRNLSYFGIISFDLSARSFECTWFSLKQDLRSGLQMFGSLLA